MQKRSLYKRLVLFDTTNIVTVIALRMQCIVRTLFSGYKSYLRSKYNQVMKEEGEAIEGQEKDLAEAEKDLAAQLALHPIEEKAAAEAYDKMYDSWSTRMMLVWSAHLKILNTLKSEKHRELFDVAYLRCEDKKGRQHFPWDGKGH